jgi:16S rRNA (uracil1498-N3)-methyltransferase
MLDRFYVENALCGPGATLTGPEAHHLSHVLRAKPGDRVVLFDGRGNEAEARVEKVRRAEVDLSIETIREVSRELPLEITLGVALPKGDRQRWLVEKAVELGVRRLVPLSTHRGVAVPTESALARLRRAVIEACKQCGRNDLMEISSGQEVGEFVRASSSDLRWLAHPGGEPLFEVAKCATGSASARLVIGPEGGFTAEETSAAQSAGWQLIDLGPRILRVETAALYLVGAISLIDGTQSAQQNRDG